MILNEGDTVRITVDENNDPDDNTYSGHDFHVGEEVRFVGDTYTGKVDKFEHLDGHDFWYVNADEYEVITATPAEPGARIAENRKSLITEQAYPIGSVWNHSSYGDERFTITGYGDTGQLCLTYGDGTHHVWDRGALDTCGTLVEAGTADDDRITEIVADKVHADAEIETLRREVKALRETLSYARERYEERDEPSSIGAFLEGARAGLRATI